MLQQQTADSRGGLLTVRVFYNAGAKLLTVEGRLIRAAARFRTMADSQWPTELLDFGCSNWLRSSQMVSNFWRLQDNCKKPDKRETYDLLRFRENRESFASLKGAAIGWGKSVHVCHLSSSLISYLMRYASRNHILRYTGRFS